MIVTTAGRTNGTMLEAANQVANELNIPFVERKKHSIEQLRGTYKDEILVVGKERIEIFPLDSDQPVFFHPNSAMFRIKRLMRGEHDPFIETSGLEKGNTLLDCTLGLGSDSIVASFVVGSKGNVTSLEANQYLHYLLRVGLHTWDSGFQVINKAMRHIEVFNENYVDFLKNCPNNKYDIVYFDPMFDETIEESDGLEGVKKFALFSNLSMQVIEEAKRVAKKRVVLKDHWKSRRFEELGFTVVRRKTSKFHFGTIQV